MCRCGGAGGFRTGTSLSVTAGDEYTITVGAGGPRNSGGSTRGSTGDNSSIAGPSPFSTIESAGGGGGGSGGGEGIFNMGLDGGSGGEWNK
ncbi:MAG: hypothetical protein CM15mV83_380 [uncultured marine virus]|nr:MAG: hypothetical protein CM15mV83_380 [uncultured marine virus]